MKKALLLLVTVLPIWAQDKTFNINATFKGSVDASGATFVLPFALKASNPSTCSPGTVIVRSDQTYGQNVYICGTSNNWVLISGGGTGTVTTVVLSVPSFLTIGGSPVTSAGSFSLGLANQGANVVFSGPASGAAAAPTFRALTPGDLPALGASGTAHAAGIAPDPGATSGSARFLREDATWVAPPVGGGGVSSVGGSNPIASSGGATPSVSCPTCVISSGSLASLSIVSGAGSQGSQATNLTTDSTLNNLTVPGTITTGDGTTAGELYMYELTVNGSQYFSWLGQNVRATTLRAQIPAADPTAGQVMLFGAPSSTISTATWGNKLATPSSNGLVSSTGSDASAGRTLTGTTNQIAVTNGDGTAGNPTIALDSIVDLSAKTATRPVKAGTSAAAPASCQANADLYIKTDATAGQQLFICNSTGNGWALLGDGNTSGGAAKYANSFTSQTAITILGTAHNLGTADLQVTIYDNGSPRKRIEADTVTINATTFDVAIAFATQQSGRYVIQ